MSDELVRVRLGDIEKNMGRALAESAGVEILDEPTHKGDGSLRGETRSGGRPVKPKTTVADSATGKKAAAVAATDTAKEARSA